MADDDSRRRVDDETILTSVRTLMTEHNPVISTSELVERLPIGRRAIQKRLNALLGGESSLARKKVGGRAVVWWLADSIVVESDGDGSADERDGGSGDEDGEGGDDG